jgi:hypothetical protein
MRFASLVVVVAATALCVPALARADSDQAPLPASPGIAFGLATGSTAAGGLLLVLATESSDDRVVVASTLLGGGLLVVGPSTGHLYAGDSGEAVGMSLLRGGAVGLFYVGFTRVFEDCDGEVCDDDKGMLMMLGGVGLWSAAAIFDMIDAPRAAARANARIAVTPTGNGIALSGTF